MPLIDSDIIKEGLLPVHQARRAYTEAGVARQAALSKSRYPDAQGGQAGVKRFVLEL